MSLFGCKPGKDPDFFDKVMAAGILSPGVARVGEVAREFVWDMKQAPGAAGENMTFKGLKNVTFTMEFYLVGDKDLTAWESWIELWDFDPTKTKPNPIDVLHPVLLERNVTVVAAKKITAPKQSKVGDNLWIGKIEAVEWRPPPKANVAKSPTGATTGISPTGATTGITSKSATDDLDREIRALTEQLKRP